MGRHRDRARRPAPGRDHRPSDRDRPASECRGLRPLRLVVSAGDPSGDRLGGALLAALRRRGVPFEASGLGGSHLRGEGLRAVADTESIAVMGFADVVRHLPGILRARRAIIALLTRDADAIFLPIDAPGLNLGLARAAKIRGRRVLYYVCPQIWAWGYGRVARIRRDVDTMLFLFRFEEAMLRGEGIPARWVGHPAGTLRPDPSARARAREEIGIGQGETLLALLPGSRPAEVRHHLGVMLDAAARLGRGSTGRLRVAVSDAGPVASMLGRDRGAALRFQTLRAVRHAGGAEPLLRAADLAFVASGTATLEAAALGTPLVVVYRTGALNYWIARRLVRVPRIGLANLVAGADVAPECVQTGATGAAIAEAARPLLDEETARERQRSGFAGISDLLGGEGASDRAAEAIMAFAEGTPARGKHRAAARSQ